MKYTTEQLEKIVSEFIGANIAENKRLRDYRLVVEQEHINILKERIVEELEVIAVDSDMSIEDIENEIIDYIEVNYMSDMEYISEESGEDTETIKRHFMMYIDAIGDNDIKYFYEHYVDMDFYENYSLKELVDMAIEEWFIFGEGFDIVKVHTYLDYDKIWEGLLKYDITQVDNGYVRID